MSDEISRREVLLSMLGLGSGYTLAAQYADERTESLLPGGADGGMATDVAFGDWDAVVTNDWDSVDVDRYPTIVAHVDDGLSVFSDGETYSTIIDLAESTMNVITTQNPADVEINNTPALLIESTSDGSTGSITLFEEGDI